MKVLESITNFALTIQHMSITKSQGFSSSEKLLANLCDRTFLRLWSYPNVYKSDEKELCDLIAVFENHVFLFFVRESKKFENPEKDIKLQWERWEKEVIKKQLTTLDGAEKYIRSSSDKIYLDQKNTIPFPLPIPTDNIVIHKIIVALGAKEACIGFSSNNIYGSLAISYSNIENEKFSVPFLLHLDKANPVHVFDSHNLEIILKELDTVYDLMTYLTVKEQAIKKYDSVCYCGEEDLLAHYFLNFDSSNNAYSIGTKEEDVNGIFIGEGEWYDFLNSSPYKLRKEANKIAELWDGVLQRTCDNALNGSLMGNSNLFNGQSAIHEMAKEPRFSRRALSEHMINSIRNFPDNIHGFARHVAFMPSFYKEKGYVFLQIKVPKEHYDKDYRPIRQSMLEIACGAAKNKFPHLKKVIGIAIDAPKLSTQNAEDFILLNCEEWTEEQRKLFEEDNKELKFFQSETLKPEIKTIWDFPKAEGTLSTRKVARNEKCPCGSGKKYKRCCGLQKK